MRSERGAWGRRGSGKVIRRTLPHESAVGMYRFTTYMGWGMFTNFLAYKLENKGGKLVEIDRWFPSSKLCSNCYHQVDEMPLDVREWICPHCGAPGVFVVGYFRTSA